LWLNKNRFRIIDLPFAVAVAVARTILPFIALFGQVFRRVPFWVNGLILLSVKTFIEINFTFYRLFTHIPFNSLKTNFKQVKKKRQ